MALTPTKSELPSLLCLLELNTSGADASTTSGTLDMSGASSQTVKQEQCYCVLHTDFSGDSLNGWEGRITESNTAHCTVSYNSILPSSQSDLELTTVSKTSSSHKSSPSRTSIIGKSDSQSSLKSWTFELQPIPYKFTHCEDENMSIFADSYRNSYTYHNMERRLKSSGGNVCGQVPRRTNFHPSSGGSQLSTMVKPKLMVLGEESHPAYKYAKPFQRKSQGYRKYISFEATDISTANILPSKPKCGKSDSAGLQGSAPLLVREKGDMSATSHPSLTPSLVEEHAHSTFTNQVKHMKMLDRYPKSPPSSDAHRTSKNAENRKPQLSTKWTSKSFPSFVVCSVDKDSQKTKMAINSKKSLHQSQRQSQFNTKTALQLSSLGNKSMPAISLNGMATRSEFGHLLTHQDQVSFGSARPGFRYETLCLQGHNTNRHNSHAPVTVVGPWISTP